MESNPDPSVPKCKLKQAIIVCTTQRDGKKMRRGKMVAQACHASVKAAMRSTVAVYKAWNEEGHKKVVLKVPNEDDLIDLFNLAETFIGLPCAIIVDHGLTQISAGSVTALAIGPAEDEVVDMITKSLRLLQ